MYNVMHIHCSYSSALQGSLEVKDLFVRQLATIVYGWNTLHCEYEFCNINSRATQTKELNMVPIVCSFHSIPVVKCLMLNCLGIIYRIHVLPLDTSYNQHAQSFFQMRVHVPPPPPFRGYRKFLEGTVVHSKISVKGTIILVHGKWDMCYCLNHITESE